MNEKFLVSFVAQSNYKETNRYKLSSAFLYIQDKIEYFYILLYGNTAKIQFERFISEYKPSEIYISCIFIGDFIEIFDSIVNHPEIKFYIGGTFSINVDFLSLPKNLIIFPPTYSIFNLFEKNNELNIFWKLDRFKNFTQFNVDDLDIVLSDGNNCYYNKCIFCSNRFLKLNQKNLDFEILIKNFLEKLSDNHKHLYIASEAIYPYQFDNLRKYEKEFFDRNITLYLQNRCDEIIVEKISKFNYPILLLSIGIETFSDWVNYNILEKNQSLSNLKKIFQLQYKKIFINLIYMDILLQKKEIWKEYEINFNEILEYKDFLNFNFFPNLILWKNNKQLILSKFKKFNFHFKIEKIIEFKNQYIEYSFFRMKNNKILYLTYQKIIFEKLKELGIHIYEPIV